MEDEDILDVEAEPVSSSPVSVEEQEDHIRSKDRSFLSPSDEGRLKRSMDIRADIAEKLYKNGEFDRKDARLINEVLSANDTSILKLAESRLKHNENKNNEVVAAALALATLQSIRSGKVDTKDLTVDGPGQMPEIPDAFKNIATVDGELEIGATILEISDFTAVKE